MKLHFINNKMLVALLAFTLSSCFAKGFTLDQCMKMCPKSYFPVCGSDGKTYGNMCVLEIQQCRNPSLKLIYAEACKALTNNINPNGVALDEDVALFNSGNSDYSPFSLDESPDLSIVALRGNAFADLAAIFGGGNSEYKVENCMKMCPKIFLPLCGSDGRTYGNKCVFEIEQCRNPKLMIIYPGPCRYVDDPCNRKCTSDFKPICGTDGITYLNLCMLMIGVCKDTELRVKHIAPCSDDDDVLAMLREWRGTPSNSSSSNGDSEFPSSPDVPDEIDKRVVFDEFVKPPEDDSCMRDCPEDGLPICGTDGVTYLNKCIFMIGLCRNPQLRVKYLLPCSSEDEEGQKNWDAELINEVKGITYDEPGKPNATEFDRASKWGEGSSEEKKRSGHRNKAEEKEESSKTDIWLDESLPLNLLNQDWISSSEEGHEDLLSSFLDGARLAISDEFLLGEMPSVSNKVFDETVTVEDLNNYIEDKVGYWLDLSSSVSNTLIEDSAVSQEFSAFIHDLLDQKKAEDTFGDNLLGSDGLQDNILSESRRRAKSLNIEDYSNGFDKYLEGLVEGTPERSPEGITEDAVEDESPSSPLDRHLFGSISKAKQLKDKLYEKFLNMLVGNIRVVPYKPETLNEFTWDSLVIYLIERIVKDMSPKGWQEIVSEAGDVESEEGFLDYIKSLVDLLYSRISEKAKSNYPNAEEMSLQELLEEMEPEHAAAVIKYLKDRIFQEFRAIWGVELPFVGPIENIWEKLEENEFNVDDFIPFDEPMAGNMDHFHMPKNSISNLIEKEIMDFCTPMSSLCQNYAAVLKTTKDVLEQITPPEKALVEDYINTKLPQDLKDLGIEEDVTDTLFSSRPANLDFLKLGIELILMQHPNEICHPNGILCNIVRLGMEVEKKVAVEMTPEQIMAIEAWVLTRMNELEKETSAIGNMLRKYAKIYEERHPNMGGIFSLDEPGLPVMTQQKKKAMDKVTVHLLKAFMSVISGDFNAEPKKGDPWTDIVLEIIKDMIQVSGPKVWGPPMGSISDVNQLKLKIGEFVKSKAPTKHITTLPDLLYKVHWQGPERLIIQNSLPYGLYEKFLQVAKTNPELVKRVNLPAGLPKYSPKPGSMEKFMKLFMHKPYGRQSRLLHESETKKETEATDIGHEWKSSSEEGYAAYLIQKAGSVGGEGMLLQDEGSFDLGLQWKSSSEEGYSGKIGKLKTKGSLEATGSNSDLFHLIGENIKEKNKKPMLLFDEAAKTANEANLAEALMVKAQALSPASVSAPVPAPAPSLAPPSKPAYLQAKALTPANTASMDLPALAAALKAVKTTSSKANTALPSETDLSAAGKSVTEEGLWYCKFVPRTDCGNTKVKKDCPQLCEGWTDKFSPEMNKMLSPDDYGLPSQISFPNGTVIPISCTVSGSVEGRFTGATFQKTLKCQENHICKEAGGKCIPKTDECEGDIVCFGCKGNGCLCCVTSDVPYYKESEPCKETDVCTYAGGTCGPAIDGCKGRIINNGCHQRKCSCCVPRSKSPTVNALELEYPVALEEKMSSFEGSWLNDWPTSDKSIPSFCKPKNRCTKLGGHCISITRECEGEIICHGCTSENCMCCIGGGFDPQWAIVTAENSAYTCKENSKCQKLGGKCISWNERCYGEIICHGCYNRDCTCCLEDTEWKANITAMQHMSTAVLESTKASAAPPALTDLEKSEAEASVANVDDSWGCQYMQLSDCTDKTVNIECPNLCVKGKSSRGSRMLDVDSKRLFSDAPDKLEARREIIRSCFNEEENGNTNKNVTDGEDFNLDLFRKLALAANPSSSVFVSPYSFVSAFVLTYFGSSGKTEQKMRKVLNVQGKAHAYDSYYNFIEAHSTSLSAGAIFRSSNNGYIDSKIPLRECISSALPNIKKLDISNPTSAAREINEQILESTNWEINNLVTPKDIHGDSLLLVNAAYFKGIWRPRFKQELTTRSVFHDESHKSTGEVDMMNDPQREVLYVDSQELEAELVGIPCGDSSIILLLMLPHGNSNVRALLKNLTPDNLNKALKNSVMETLELSIPKFKLETKMDDNLRKVIKSVFSPLFTKKTDLSGFTDTPIHIHKLLHKAVVDIAEEGDGDTNNFRQPRSSKTKIKFNRPFVYLIRDNSGTTLFAGVFRSASDVEKIEK